MLSALNDTKSAFVSLTFAASHFFRYTYEGGETSPEKFYCSILIRVWFAPILSNVAMHLANIWLTYG